MSDDCVYCGDSDASWCSYCKVVQCRFCHNQNDCESLDDIVDEDHEENNGEYHYV